MWNVLSNSPFASPIADTARNVHLVFWYLGWVLLVQFLVVYGAKAYLHPAVVVAELARVAGPPRKNRAAGGPC